MNFKKSNIIANLNITGYLEEKGVFWISENSEFPMVLLKFEKLFG